MSRSVVAAASKRPPTDYSYLLAADGQSREFVWACELTREKPMVTWGTDEDIDEDADFLRHTLFLKQAVLGAAAVNKEQNIVSLETKNFYMETIKQPIISLTSGITDSCLLDLTFAGDIPVTFRLTSGTGPVHITASHLIEFPSSDPNDPNVTYADAPIDIEVETEEDDAKYELAENPAPIQVIVGKSGASAVDKKSVGNGSKKRKAPATVKPSPQKRGKLEVDTEMAENDSDDDDSDDDDEEDEDEDENGDEDDEDEEEEDAGCEENSVVGGKKNGKDSGVHDNDSDDDDDDADGDEEEAEEEESDEEKIPAKIPAKKSNKTPAQMKSLKHKSTHRSTKAAVASRVTVPSKHKGKKSK